jgi:hypothetical protein
MQQTPTQSEKVTQGAPMTEEAFFALTGQRDELKAQLKALSQRRNELSEQRAVLSKEDGRDHDLRIRAIDQRSAEIDRQIMSLDVAIAKARSQPIIAADQIAAAAQRAARAAIASLPPVPPPRQGNDTARIAMFGTAVVTIVAIVAIYKGVMRIFAPRTTASVEGQSRRLDQLQQSIDVIALEVERMSESQRFVAKVLNEKMPALGVGEAVSAKAKDAAKF